MVRKVQQSAMEYPHSIAFSADREEWAVSDKWANRIFIFNRENVLLRVLGDKGEAIGFLRSPEGLAIDLDIIYVCDTGNDRVQVRLIEYSLSKSVFLTIFPFPGFRFKIRRCALSIRQHQTRANL